MLPELLPRLPRRLDGMYVILWEYEVLAEQASKFVAAYRADGAWAQLFGEAKGYLGTELLPHIAQLGMAESATESFRRYMTIACWASTEDFARFHEEFSEPYKGLGVRCESLTLGESRIGSFTALDGRAAEHALTA